MENFAEFSEYCPNRDGRVCRPLWTIHGPYGKCGCEAENCASFHVYQKVMGSLEELENRLDEL